MATLKAFQKPEGFNLPQEYKKENLDSSSGISFINKITSEMEGFEKYVIGRSFEKTSTISYPGDEGIVSREVTRQKTLLCTLYIPLSDLNTNIYIVGPECNALFPEILHFGGVQALDGMEIDIAELERKSFNSGVINLVGHKYNLANGTISFSVRKIDGIPFNQNDPDFTSCEITEKEVLEVKLNIQGTPSTFHVHADGKITRRGPDENGSTQFNLLKVVYDIIFDEIQN